MGAMVRPDRPRASFVLAIAEGVADILPDGLHQHTGCAVTLIGIRYDEIDSNEATFVMASRRAMALNEND
jgi:hypothetical protein